MSEEPRRLKRSVIKEEFIKLTGDLTEAVILNQMIYWTERVKDFDQFITEIQKNQDPQKEKIPLLHGWIYKTSDELAEETLLLCSRHTIRRGLISLIDKGLIAERANPDAKWDKTTQYRVNLLAVDQGLRDIGFNGLSAYAFSTRLPMKKVTGSNEQNARSEDQNALPSDENDRAITETTTETTTESFSKEKESTLRVQAASKVAVNRTRNKQSIPCEDTSDAEYIIEHVWNEKNLRKHRKGTKTYASLVRMINKLLAGKYVFADDLAKYNGKKFNRRNFIKAITQFELAATNPAYEVSQNSTYKDYLKHLPMDVFIYNERSTNGNRSLFLKYLENDAKLLSEKFVKDEDPELTEAIMSEYKRQTRGDVSNKVPFIKASNKLNAFLAENQSKIAAGMTPTNNMLAELLVSALTKGNGKTPAHYLHSDLTFKEILPEHFRREAVFKARNEEKPMRYKMATI